MLKLNYNIHLILNSKYKVLINLFIILAIYTVLYGNKMALCMNENLDTVDVPVAIEEFKEEIIRPSHQVQALMEEIRSYAGPQIHLLERIDQQDALLKTQEGTIRHLEKILAKTDKSAYRMYMEVDEPIYGIIYKQKMEYYKDQVIHFSNNERIAKSNLFMRTKELERANALLTEAKQEITVLKERCRELERLNRI